MRRLLASVAALGLASGLVIAQDLSPAQSVQVCADLAKIVANDGRSVSAVRTAATDANTICKAATPAPTPSPAPAPAPTPTPTPAPSPSPSPSPSPAPGAAVLDDFSQGLRTVPIIGNIWSHYGEGASGSAVVSNGQLVETVGAVTNTSGGGAYLQFQPKANDSYAWPAGYAQSHLVSGTYPAGANRLTFRVMTSKAMSKPTNGGPNIEFGTYIRKHTETDANFQGAHFYHQLGVNFPANRWVYITITCVPQHQVGDNNITNYPCNPTGDGYFDDLTRFYFDGIYGGGANATWTYDDFRFSRVDGEPDLLVSTPWAVYDGSKYQLSWATPKNQAVSYTVYCSTTSMHANGLSAGSVCATATSTGNTYVDGPNAVTAAMPQAPVEYFAIVPAGSSTFTEVSIPAN
jgi:hypothetical protein